MRFIRWDPFQQMVAMSNRLNRTLEDSYTPRTEDSRDAWAPPVNIFERRDHLVMQAEIPGVQKEDMDIQIDNGVLTVHGERKHETDVKEEDEHRMERVYGTFRRSFTLPTTVDAAKVTATYKDGVLELMIPRVETAKPKQVEIKAA